MYSKSVIRLLYTLRLGGRREVWKRRLKNPYVLVWTMKMETKESLRSGVNHENGDEESLRSSVNHENGDERIITFWCEPWKWRRKNHNVLVWTMKMETEESLRSSVNHENGDERIITFWSMWTMKMETEESLRSSVNHENGDGRIITF